MNYAFLPDLFALAILVVILGLVRRRHSDPRADAWLIGLFFTLVEAAAHTLYATQGIPNRLLHVVVLDCYLMAGLVFNWAASDQNLPLRGRILSISLNGLTLLFVTTIYGWNIRVPQVYIPFIIFGMVVGVANALVIRGDWRFGMAHIAGWTAMGVLISEGHIRESVYWSLACVYMIAALNFQRRLPRKSTGRLAIVTGFTIWALNFLLHPWIISRYPHYADIASHVWNMQKSLISIGMILVMLEEQVSNNEWLALHDELTGLPNRRLFAARLTNAIEYAEQRKTNLAVVVVDVNDFKTINDTMGHLAGDQVLREVSVALRKNIRATDTVARLGGDEFIIVATDMASENSVDRFMQSLQNAIERPIIVNDHAMVVGASLGFSIFPRDAKDATKLLRIADQRMYALKKRPVQTAVSGSGVVTTVQQA
jgi:diguanylate cyclase (GGDEF)-like protein